MAAKKKVRAKKAAPKKAPIKVKGPSRKASRPKKASRRKKTIGAQLGEMVVPRVLGHGARALTRKHLGDHGSRIVEQAVIEATAEFGAQVGHGVQALTEEYGPLALDGMTTAAGNVSDTVTALRKRFGW